MDFELVTYSKLYHFADKKTYLQSYAHDKEPQTDQPLDQKRKSPYIVSIVYQQNSCK